MSDVITFYDIPSIKGISWSPNTWKTRLALNFKGIPYKTVWVEYPDIEALSKEIGAAPTGVKGDGSPSYTLPAIYDPKTKKAISDSQNIAEYLDATYPSTPTLFSAGTLTLQIAFQEAFTTAALGNLFAPLLQESGFILNERSAVYFRQTREATYGKKLEEFSPLGAVRDEHWKKTQAGFSTVAGWIQKSGGLYVMGDKASYADLSIAAWVLWVRQVRGASSADYQNILTWDSGFWGKYLAALDKYTTPDA
ncbi:hypothetical protein GLOTRDRAFT_76900 [Gloeophyllum trabeum ATCC 11539]|uniref:GST N-terminal domain-containing protein n=1 Tax=Gloeophyllum trabeum (strain ATCC 11539 / FP-39264 / Madison 617) TaxID=670483 RepID=S7Q4H4_GLOTA|nr:uncharacterized protein GLOTRDRAFT_76900 [Gloeophyllum trabeum ATCC 11539]EPQ54407.1 hypothetical protein GLOTRDRAFT_76900 [Gloeophyllum trabeum ATCC 11539]